MTKFPHLLNNTSTLPLLQKLKILYLLWYQCFELIPKPHKYTIGQRIDNLFVEIIENTAIAGFLGKEEKLPYIKIAIRKTGTLKIFLMILWETKSINNKKYIVLSEKIEEIGRMLGGWNGQLIKQNLSK